MEFTVLLWKLVCLGGRVGVTLFVASQ